MRVVERLRAHRWGQQVRQSHGQRRSGPVTLSKELQAAGSHEQQQQLPAEDMAAALRSRTPAEAASGLADAWPVRPPYRFACSPAAPPDK